MVGDLACQLLGNDIMFGHNAVINFSEDDVKLEEGVLNIQVLVYNPKQPLNIYGKYSKRFV